MYTEKQLRALIREELRRTIVSHHKRQLREQDEAEPTEDETGGGKLVNIKRGLTIAFPDWADDIKNLKIQPDKLDYFASMIQDVLKLAVANRLERGAKRSEQATKTMV